MNNETSSKTEDAKWYGRDVADLLAMFSSHAERGLADEQIVLLQDHYGKNKLPDAHKETFFSIFLRQFQSPLLYILIAASVAALLLGELTDGLIILGVLVFNAIIGSFQEGKAQNALFALKKFEATETLVVRNGETRLLPSSELVPGDLIVIREGDKIPADARIISAKNLKVDEAMLTGESVPVAKDSQTLASKKDIVISDQKNMVFKGTHVTAGRGTALVVATGLETEIGKISQNLGSKDTEIPLQKSIKKLARIIIIATIGIIGILFAIGMLTGGEFRDMLLVAISLMVSVIPEGLPIVMTLILARGVKRMSERNALVKRLQAVEALGQATVIAVDKTGTLTKNELVVQKIYTGTQLLDVTGVGYEPSGDVQQAGVSVSNPAIALLATYAAMSANANVFSTEEGYKVTGDPTEAALLVFGNKLGKEKESLLKKTPLIADIPFDYKKKYYGTLFQEDTRNVMVFTGAPEALLEKCTRMFDSDGKAVPLNEKGIVSLQDIVHDLSKQGLRVIAITEKSTDKKTVGDDDVHDLTFVGFCAMKDALRAEVPDAMKKAQEAGMKVVMITGDHVVTARAIAEEAGVWREGDDVLTGPEILTMDQDELIKKLDTVTVFARVTPEHKMHIIEAYQKRGDIIAMTGDGVNDVPPLVAADLGVAMGRIGTEVTKEAADIILLDDNFGNIPVAVEEGRNIYATIKKTLVYLFSTNLAELLVIAVAVVLVFPLPLTPAQIVWLNLVTDSFLVMTLAFLPHDAGLLKGRGEKLSPYILDRKTTSRLILFALVITAGTLSVFFAYQPLGIAHARTMVLITLGFFQVFRLWSIKSNTVSVFAENPLRSGWIIGASLLAIGLQVFAVHVPFMNKVLETVVLRPHDWGIALVVAFVIILIDEVRKFFARRK